MRILVVNEDNLVTNLLKRSLTDHRHVVDMANNGQAGWEYLESNQYELILLSLHLPKMNGISFCSEMRSQGYTIPILLIIARDACQAGIQGLDAGADDYITKPLDLKELNARIRALSRRKKVIPHTVIQVNELVLDPTSCQVNYKTKPLKLTAKEYSILELFLRNPQRVYSRSQILDLIWTFENPPSEESVKTHIQGLRKKLRQVGAKNWIENIYGMGYILNPPVTSVREYSILNPVVN
jgi:DNA-binding response OmpR family regulator